jgi:hypothetical protein
MAPGVVTRTAFGKRSKEGKGRTMMVARKILAAAALTMLLSLTACGRKPQPRPEYGEAFVDNMIECLYHPEPQMRYNAARALAEMNHPIARKAVCPLTCLLDDDDCMVRHEAARAIRKIDPSM